jgi:uncharacterized membrane protein (Fun14 family)
LDPFPPSLSLFPPLFEDPYSLQLLAHNGYLHVDWKKVEETTTSVLDVNHDGKLDQKDLSFLLHKGLNILSGNMAATGSGFTAGFLYGLKKG